MLSVLTFFCILIINLSDVRAGAVEDAFIKYSESHNEFSRKHRALKNKNKKNIHFLRQNILAPAKKQLTQAIKDQRKKSIDKRLSKYGVIRVEGKSSSIKDVFQKRKKLASDLNSLRGANANVKSQKDIKLEEVSVDKKGIKLDGKNNPRFLEFKKQIKKKKKLTPKQQELLQMGIHPK